MVVRCVVNYCGMLRWTPCTTTAAAAAAAVCETSRWQAAGLETVLLISESVHWRLLSLAVGAAPLDCGPRQTTAQRLSSRPAHFNTLPRHSPLDTVAAAWCALSVVDLGVGAVA